MEARVTEDCIACERCVEICGAVFEMGEQYAEVRLSPIPAEYEEAMEEAVEECPTSAIIIE